MLAYLSVLNAHNHTNHHCLPAKCWRPYSGPVCLMLYWRPTWQSKMYWKSPPFVCTALALCNKFKNAGWCACGSCKQSCSLPAARALEQCYTADRQTCLRIRYHCWIHIQDISLAGHAWTLGNNWCHTCHLFMLAFPCIALFKRQNASRQTVNQSVVHQSHVSWCHAGQMMSCILTCFDAAFCDFRHHHTWFQLDSVVHPAGNSITANSICGQHLLLLKHYASSQQ